MVDQQLILPVMSTTTHKGIKMKTVRQQPKSAGLTQNAWYVHVEGKSLDPMFHYTAKTELAYLTLTSLLVQNTFLDPSQLEFFGIGYEDVTFVVDSKHLANYLAEELNKVLPRASDEWMELGGAYHNAVAVYMVEESQDIDGDLFWVCSGGPA